MPRSLVKNAAGNLEAGDPKPYSAAAWYLKITQLPRPQDALFVEARIVFDEPDGWFQGTSPLASRLRLAVTQKVREARVHCEGTLANKQAAAK